jgi:uracil-DNA glycosylase
VHQFGVPFDDASGDCLHDWLGVSREVFYDPSPIAIMPMGFFFAGSYAGSGKGKSGDLPPRYAPTWHHRLLAQLPNIQLICWSGNIRNVTI